MSMIHLIILFMIFSLLLFLIHIFLSKKKNIMREKMSPFECGFNPMSNPRMPFSIQFFLISLTFLIFDIEISLLIPLIFSINMFNLFMIFSLLIFMMILIFSIYFEYLNNMLEWKKN